MKNTHLTCCYYTEYLALSRYRKIIESSLPTQLGHPGGDVRLHEKFWATLESSADLASFSFSGEVFGRSSGGLFGFRLGLAFAM